MCVITVDLTDDGQTDSLEIRFHDDPTQLARKFIARHGLDEEVFEPLVEHIAENKQLGLNKLAAAAAKRSPAAVSWPMSPPPKSSLDALAAGTPHQLGVFSPLPQLNRTAKTDVSDTPGSMSSFQRLPSQDSTDVKRVPSRQTMVLQPRMSASGGSVSSFHSGHQPPGAAAAAAGRPASSSSYERGNLTRPSGSSTAGGQADGDGDVRRRSLSRTRSDASLTRPSSVVHLLASSSGSGGGGGRLNASTTSTSRPANNNSSGQSSSSSSAIHSRLYSEADERERRRLELERKLEREQKEAWLRAKNAPVKVGAAASSASRPYSSGTTGSGVPVVAITRGRSTSRGPAAGSSSAGRFGWAGPAAQALEQQQQQQQAARRLGSAASRSRGRSASAASHGHAGGGAGGRDSRRQSTSSTASTTSLGRGGTSGVRLQRGRSSGHDRGSRSRSPSPASKIGHRLYEAGRVEATKRQALLEALRSEAELRAAGAWACALCGGSNPWDAPLCTNALKYGRGEMDVGGPLPAAGSKDGGRMLLRVCGAARPSHDFRPVISDYAAKLPGRAAVITGSDHASGSGGWGPDGAAPGGAVSAASFDAYISAQISRYHEERRRREATAAASREASAAGLTFKPSVNPHSEAIVKRKREAAAMAAAAHQQQQQQQQQEGYESVHGTGAAAFLNASALVPDAVVNSSTTSTAAGGSGSGAANVYESLYALAAKKRSGNADGASAGAVDATFQPNIHINVLAERARSKQGRRAVAGDSAAAGASNSSGDRPVAASNPGLFSPGSKVAAQRAGESTAAFFARLARHGAGVGASRASRDSAAGASSSADANKSRVSAASSALAAAVVPGVLEAAKRYAAAQAGREAERDARIRDDANRKYASGASERLLSSMRRRGLAGAYSLLLQCMRNNASDDVTDGDRADGAATSASSTTGPPSTTSSTNRLPTYITSLITGVTSGGAGGSRTAGGSIFVGASSAAPSMPHIPAERLAQMLAAIDARLLNQQQQQPSSSSNSGGASGAMPTYSAALAEVSLLLSAGIAPNGVNRSHAAAATASSSLSPHRPSSSFSAAGSSALSSIGGGEATDDVSGAGGAGMSSEARKRLSDALAYETALEEAAAADVSGVTLDVSKVSAGAVRSSFGAAGGEQLVAIVMTSVDRMKGRALAARQQQQEDEEGGEQQPLLVTFDDFCAVFGRLVEEAAGGHSLYLQARRAKARAMLALTSGGFNSSSASTASASGIDSGSRGRSNGPSAGVVRLRPGSGNSSSDANSSLVASNQQQGQGQHVAKLSFQRLHSEGAERARRRQEMEVAALRQRLINHPFVPQSQAAGNSASQQPAAIASRQHQQAAQPLDLAARARQILASADALVDVEALRHQQQERQAVQSPAFRFSESSAQSQQQQRQQQQQQPGHGSGANHASMPRSPPRSKNLYGYTPGPAGKQQQRQPAGEQALSSVAASAPGQSPSSVTQTLGHAGGINSDGISSNQPAPASPPPPRAAAAPSSNSHRSGPPVASSAPFSSPGSSSLQTALSSLSLAALSERIERILSVDPANYGRSN